MDDKLTHQNLEISGLRYDTSFRQLSSQKQTIFLRSQLNKVFLALIHKKEQVVSREELIEKIWHGNHHTGAKALTHSICKLRKIFTELEDEKTKIITIPKYGYCLSTNAAALNPNL